VHLACVPHRAVRFALRPVRELRQCKQELHQAQAKADHANQELEDVRMGMEALRTRTYVLATKLNMAYLTNTGLTTVVSLQMELADAQKAASVSALDSAAKARLQAACERAAAEADCAAARAQSSGASMQLVLKELRDVKARCAAAEAGLAHCQQQLAASELARAEVETAGMETITSTKQLLSRMQELEQEGHVLRSSLIDSHVAQHRMARELEAANAECERLLASAAEKDAHSIRLIERLIRDQRNTDAMVQRGDEVIASLQFQLGIEPEEEAALSARFLAAFSQRACARLLRERSKRVGKASKA